MAAILNSAILNSAILGFPLKLTHTCQDWFPPFAQKKTSSHLPPHHLHEKKLYSLLLTQLNYGSHLEFCHLEFCHLELCHLSISSQTDSHLPRLVPTISTKKTSPLLHPHHLHGKKLHSFILTQLDDGSHLEFCHFGLRHCHLGFRHLVFFSQIHSKTLSLHSDSDSD